MIKSPKASKENNEQALVLMPGSSQTSNDLNTIPEEDDGIRVAPSMDIPLHRRSTSGLFPRLQVPSVDRNRASRDDDDIWTNKQIELSPEREKPPMINFKNLMKKCLSNYPFYA